jgi:hypothetical protein
MGTSAGALLVWDMREGAKEPWFLVYGDDETWHHTWLGAPAPQYPPLVGRRASATCSALRMPRTHMWHHSPHTQSLADCVSGYTLSRVTHGSDRDLVPLTPSVFKLPWRLFWLARMHALCVPASNPALYYAALLRTLASPRPVLLAPSLRCPAHWPGLAWSADSQQLATMDVASTVRVWWMRPVAGQQVEVHEMHRLPLVPELAASMGPQHMCNSGGWLLAVRRVAGAGLEWLVSQML